MRSRPSHPQQSLVWLAFVCCAIIATGAAHAAQTMATGANGTAINGYDPVAYFTMGKPVRGSERYSYDWLGATWQFVSSKHRALFIANPTRYAPQHGGYCSAGATVGVNVNADPEAWRIVDGRLYLFALKELAEDFERGDPDVVKADADWQRKLMTLIGQ